MEKVRVLIAIDEPRMAKIIVNTACNILDKKRSEITLLNVSEDMIEEEEYFYRAPQKFMEHEAEKSEFAEIENMLENEGYDYKGFVYKEGNPANVIVQNATRENYDLIVLGSHNKHAFQRLFLGSVSYKVSKYAKTSLMVIKPTELSETSPDENYSALFAADISEYSEYASNRAVDFLDKKRASISILNVTIPVQDIIPVDAYAYADMARIMQEADLIADELIRDTAINISRHGLTVEKKYHIAGDAPSVIIDEAKKNSAKLIIMGSHGKTGIAGWFLGSTSSRVYEYSPISVLIIRKG